ncbi:MAG: DMT family transporter [Pseudomonadota bacterium]
MGRKQIAWGRESGHIGGMIVQKTLTPAGWAQLCLLTLIWGGTFLSIRFVLDEVPFITSVLHRVGWAALALWGYILIRDLPLPRDWQTWGAFAVMGLLNNVIPFLLMAWGQLYIESGLTAIFNAGTAVFTVLVAALLLRDERLTLRKALGVGLGFAGVLIAVGLQNLGELDLRSLAQWAVILGTLSYALAAVWGRLHLGTLRPEVAATGMLTWSTIFMIPLALIYDGVPTLALQTPTLWAMAHSSLIATAAAYLLYYHLLATAGSGNVSLVTMMVAPVAIILGAVVRAEALASSALIGFAILAVGLLILNRTLFPRARW